MELSAPLEEIFGGLLSGSMGGTFNKSGTTTNAEG